jgi:Phage antirepressor protein KilAC domain
MNKEVNRMTDVTLFGESPFDAIKFVDERGVERWSGRGLMDLMAYTRWESFQVPLNRAMKAAANTGLDVTSLFRRSPEKSNGGRPGGDYELDREAAYLTAMNGDPNKPEVAAAQVYFAVKTREAEVARPSLPDISTPSGVLAMAEQFAATARRLVEVEARNAELKPLAAAEEHHRSARGLKAVGDFANDLKAWAKTNHPNVKVRHQAVWDHLARLDMVIRGNTVRHNQPTANAVEQGWCVPKVSDYDTPHGAETSTTTRLTPKGEGYAWDRITAYIEANGTLELPRRIGGVA